MSEKVIYEQDRCRWVSLHSAACGEIREAIKKLKRISFSDQAIGDLLETLLKDDMKMRKRG